MLYNSFEFVLFVCTTLLAYRLSGSMRPRILLVASVIFYCFWSIPYAGLLALNVIWAYALGRRIQECASAQSKSRWLAAGLLGLAANLVFFKYATDLNSLFYWSLGLFGRAGEAHPVLRIAAPLGISYTTFKLMSYLIDVYWEKSSATDSVTSLALYTFFFPQIISGPIQRFVDFCPQIRTAVICPPFFTSGLRLLLFGFFKKWVIADPLYAVVDKAFANPAASTGAGLLIAMYCFAFQIYADFSAITDIARGTAALFGFQTPEN
ncbi:MAG: hypothetical protein HQL11_04490, partial [Candidatus Omnitrophica bacterium]|nr:hypothetical protein [Candidatus Omnitrophota bacterium]